MRAPAEEEAVLVRFRCTGHRNIRARHDATLELAAAGEISQRATCVVGVATSVIEGSPFGIAGSVTITIEVSGHHHQQISAVANPWLGSSDQGFVVRRSFARLDDTLATESDTAAADLDRGLVESLRDPAAEIVVTVGRAPHRADSPSQLVIGTPGSTGGRRAAVLRAVLRAELDAAGVVLADDAVARRRLRRATSVAEARTTLAEGGRVLLLGSAELAGALVDDLLDDLLDEQDDLRTEAFGMSPSLAAASVVGGTAPLVLLQSLSTRAEIDHAVGLLASGARIAASVTPERARKLLRDSSEHVRVAGIVTDPGTASQRLVRARRQGFGDVVPSSSRQPIVVALGGSGSTEPYEIPPRFLDALVAQGIAPSRIAAALASQPGWSRNRAYRTIGVRSGEE